MGSRRRALVCVDVGASRGTCGWAEAPRVLGWGLRDYCYTACWELRAHRMTTWVNEAMRQKPVSILHRLFTSHEVDSCAGGQGTKRWHTGCPEGSFGGWWLSLGGTRVFLLGSSLKTLHCGQTCSSRRHPTSGILRLCWVLLWSLPETHNCLSDPFCIHL